MIVDLFRRVKTNKTLMNGTMFSIFSFINKGISFVLLVILARYIAPAEYGRLSLFSTIVQLLGYCIALSTTGFFSVSYFQRKGELFRQDFTSIIIITVFCTTVIGVVLLFSQDAIAKLADLPPAYLWVALVICFADVFFHCFMDLLRIQEKVLKYGFFSCGVALINFAFSLYLVVAKDLNWQGRVYAHLFCSVLFGAIGFFILAKKRLFTRHISWPGIKMIILWGIPLIPHHAASWIKQGCDRFIIKGTHTIEDVGIFSFALTLTSVIVMIGTAFNATNSVSVYQILSSGVNAKTKKKQLKNQTRNIGVIYTVGYLLVLIGASLLVPLLLPKYTDSLPYFWITSVYGYLNCLYFLFVNYLFYYHRNHSIMMITFISSCVHLGLSLILTRYSLYWTAIIYVITQSVILILIAQQAIKVVRKEVVE